MSKIIILGVYGFEHAIRAMRLPMKSLNKSDSFECTGSEVNESYCVVDPNLRDQYEKVIIGKRDRELSTKLTNAGTSHRKHLRLIDAWFEIRMPLYWWKEFDTYRMGVDKLSESTMHTLMKRPIEASDFQNFALTKEEVSHLEEIRLSGDFDKLNKVLPQSYLQTRIVKCSYEALRAMYHDRKDHKLMEWRNFCRVVRTLPNSWMIVE